jgi:hypothetical protein
MLAEMVAARSELPPGQKIFARSLPRFDTTISPCGLPCPGDAGRGRQAIVSDLRRLEVERIAYESFRRPAILWREPLPGLQTLRCQASKCPSSSYQTFGGAAELFDVQRESHLELGAARS